MEWGWLLVVFFVIMFAFLIPGVWIAAALGVTGLLGLMISGNLRHIETVGNISWNTGNDFVLTAIPLFLFMGEVILNSGLSGAFYRSIAKWLQRVPGGLLHSNIIACAIFSAISGSSVATAAGIGSVAIPEMKKRGYDRKAIYGSIAAGGTLGILIPPSIVLILYGAMVDESIVQLFTAAIIPGLVLTGLFLIYTGFSAFRIKNGKMHAPLEKMGVLTSLKGIFPLIFLIVLVMGSLYSGKATPTEAAAVGAFLAVVIGYIFGDLNLMKITKSLVNSVKTTSMIVMIMIGAQIFSFAIVSSGISRSLITWITDANLSKWLLFAMVCVIYIILGFFMDGPSMLFLTIPLLYPVMMNAGFDPIWFGVILVILIELGQITPPMGLNLFVIQSIDSASSITEIVRGVLPYVAIMLVMIIILAFFPGLALWYR